MPKTLACRDRHGYNMKALTIFFSLKVASFSMMSPGHQDSTAVCRNNSIRRSCWSKSRDRTCVGSNLPMLQTKEAAWQKRSVGPRGLGLGFSSSETALTLLANSNYSCWKENIFDISGTFPWDTWGLLLSFLSQETNTGPVEGWLYWLSLDLFKQLSLWGKMWLSSSGFLLRCPCHPVNSS